MPSARGARDGARPPAVLRPGRRACRPQRDARSPARLPRLRPGPLRERGAPTSSSSARGATCSRPPTCTSRRATCSTRTRPRCSPAASTASPSSGRTRTPASGSSTSIATTRARRSRVWTAFDRALRLAEDGQLPDEQVDAVARAARAARAPGSRSRCWSDELGAYCGWAGEESSTPGSCAPSRMGYPERERLDRTVDTIRERLGGGARAALPHERARRRGGRVRRVLVLARRGSRAARPRRRGLRDDGADPPVRERPRALLGGGRPGERRAPRELPAGAEPPGADQRCGRDRGCSAGRVPAVHRRRQVRREVEGGVDEREVRERLREVPEQALRLGVVLLGEQAEVVARGRRAARTARAPRRAGRAARSSRRARTSTAGRRPRPAGSPSTPLVVACGSAARSRRGAARARSPRSCRGRAGRSPAGSRRAAAAAGSRRAPSSRTTA